MRVTRIIAPALVLIAAGASVSGAQVNDDYRAGAVASEFAPPIDLWLDQDSYDRGARMRPHFSTEPGAYVVVVRVTSDGELRVMYPGRPGSQRPYVLGQFTDDRMPYSDDPAGSLYESSGRGFVFAIASYQRFDFGAFRQGNSWSTARLATFGRYADPFQAVRNFVDEILPLTAEYSLDYEVYEVYSRGVNRGYASSLYGGRHGYYSLNDYHDACLSAFGIRQSYYCRSYRGGYYGPIIVVNPRMPRSPSPAGPKMKQPRPVSPDPIVPKSPIAPEGTQTDRDVADARERSERAMRRATPGERRSDPVVRTPRVDRNPRVEAQPRGPVIYRTAPRSDAPRAEPRSVPQRQPHTDSRPVGHQVQRSEPRAPVVRSQPRAEPRPQVERSQPKAVERAAAKENGKT
ncbi:MAG: hypothetical protein ACSLFK_00145 [Gemmatimonadaceae bacterium]